MSALAAAVRSMADAKLAELIRVCTDDEIIDFLRRYLATVRPTKSAAPARAEPAKRKAKRVRVRKVRTTKPVASQSESESKALGSSAEQVRKVLAAADGEVSAGEVVRSTKLSVNAVKSALYLLGRAGIAQHNGKRALGSRWSLAL